MDTLRILVADDHDLMRLGSRGVTYGVISRCGLRCRPVAIVLYSKLLILDSPLQKE
jgi:hypothetical protein